jgi:putative cardiolipin synthase
MVLALLLAGVLIGGCSGLPSLDDRSASTALADTGDTRLGRAIAP